MSQANGAGTEVKYILHFCNVMIFALIKIRASPPRHDKMHVERSPSGKLYLVRKKYTPPKSKPREEFVEVYENLAEAGHVEVVQVEHLRAKDKHNHHHPRCADDKKPVDNNGIRIDIGGLEDGTKHIIVGNSGTPGGISITVGAHKRCKAADQPAHPSPNIIIREPIHVKQEKPAADAEKKKAKQEDVQLEPVRWEKVRVKKVHRPAEEVRVYKRSPKPEAERLPRDDHEKYTEIKVPRREQKPHRMPEVEGAVWDEKLKAWIVKRSPRVRFD
ncbi:hypothetical protein HRR75_003811 [Exophiala dermatitidis]|nr:hypothetical protein HRR75_003811 [Exophiala dermatitidis]